MLNHILQLLSSFTGASRFSQIFYFYFYFFVKRLIVFHEIVWRTTQNSTGSYKRKNLSLLGFDRILGECNSPRITQLRDFLRPNFVPKLHHALAKPFAFLHVPDLPGIFF